MNNYTGHVVCREQHNYIKNKLWFVIIIHCGMLNRFNSTCTLDFVMNYNKLMYVFSFLKLHLDNSK